MLRRVRQPQCNDDLLQLFFDGFQVVDDALGRLHCDTRKRRPVHGFPRLDNRIVEGSQIVRRPADDEQERIQRGVDSFRFRGFSSHSDLKSYTLNAMNCLVATVALLSLLGFASGADAQSGGVHVSREKVDAALAKSGVLVDAPQVRIAGVHRDKPGALETRDDTTIIYVTDGTGLFSAGTQSSKLSKGDVLVVPAGTTQSFTSVSPAISYLLVTVPVTAKGTKAELVHVPAEKVSAAMKKAGPLADGPNLRVSGGYRTGPYAPANYRPAVEIHTNEADLFYIIDGSATQVLGGTVVGGKETAAGQIRGTTIDGGQTYQVRQGDVMWVPAGVPHWFPEIPTPLSYLLVKVFY